MPKKNRELVRFNAYIWKDQKGFIEKQNKKSKDENMNESKVLRDLIDTGITYKKSA